MSKNTPTRFPKGVGTATAETAFGMLGMPNPFKYHVYADDFTIFGIDNWFVTDTSTGTPTYTVADTDGGVLAILNGTADNDHQWLMSGTSAGAGESYTFETGKAVWFSTKIKISDATQSDFFAGLVIATATDPVGTAPTDGIFFRKDDGDTNIDFVVTKDSTATTATAITTASDDTFVELAFYYDGDSTITYFVADVRAGTSVTTNLPDDEELAIFYGLQNGEAAAKTLSLDWIFAAKER